MSEEQGLPGVEPQEVPPQEPAPQPEPQPVPESDVLVRYRGEERPIPQAGIDALAAAFNTTPERTVSWLQMQMDANRAWNEAEKQRQRADAVEQRWQQHLQSQPGYSQPASPYDRPGTPQFQPPPPPPYQPTNGYPSPAPYQPYQPAPEDPIELLRATQREVREMRQSLEQRERAWEERRREEAISQDEARWNSAAGRFLEEKNKGRKNHVTLEQLQEEVRLSGMHLGNMAPERIFEKAWKVITYDEAGQTAEQKLMTRLRDPGAKVVIPGAPSSQPAPASQKPKEPDFGTLRLSDVIENIPMKR
jgi:hypothetical protein